MLENKYTKWYYQIINHAKSRNILTKVQAKKILGYPELHHIIPKCLGGLDDQENIVFLTGKEHLICHLLLTKMHLGKDKNKMVHAAWAMTTLENEYQQRYKINSRIYEIVRKQYADIKSKQLLGKPGRKHSTETKKKISEFRLGKKTRPMSEESKKKLSESLKGKNLGKKRTPEQRQAQSEKQKGRAGTKHTVETKQKLKEINLGKKLGPMSEKHKKSISDALKGIPKNRESVEKQRQKILGRVQTNQERTNYLKAMEEGKQTCLYCGKKTTKGNYIRWHGDNCKFRQ